jgi:sugar phosphate isomerase/epimerase
MSAAEVGRTDAPRLAASLRPDELRGERAAALRAAGVAAELDLSHPHLRELPRRPGDARAGRIRAALHGRAPASTHAPHAGLDPLSPDPTLARYARASLRRALRVTVALGADRMVLHSGLPFRRDEAATLDHLERATPFLAELAAEAGDAGVLLLLENTTERDPACLRPLFEALPEIGFCFDPAHALAFADVVDPEAWRIVLGPWLRHLHLSGTRPGVDRHLPLAAGVGTSATELAAWTSALPGDAVVVLETVPFERADVQRVRDAWASGRSGRSGESAGSSRWRRVPTGVLASDPPPPPQ